MSTAPSDEERAACILRLLSYLETFVLSCQEAEPPWEPIDLLSVRVQGAGMMAGRTLGVIQVQGRLVRDETFATKEEVAWRGSEVTLALVESWSQAVRQGMEAYRGARAREGDGTDE